MILVPESSLTIYSWPYLEPREARALLGDGELHAWRDEHGEPCYDRADLEALVGEENEA